MSERYYDVVVVGSSLGARVAAALLAFNLGVEAGQLLVVAAVIALLAILVRAAPKAETPALRIATYSIGAVGSFWLIERVIG